MGNTCDEKGTTFLYKLHYTSLCFFRGSGQCILLAVERTTSLILLYKVQCFIGISGTDKLIISHVRLCMIILYVKIIAFQSVRASGYFILLEKAVYIKVVKGIIYKFI